MQLNKEQQTMIKNVAQDVFDYGVDVSVYGSMLDDSYGGWDFDVLISSDHMIEDKPGKCQFMSTKLQLALGDQPIHVVVIDPATDPASIDKRVLNKSRPL